MELKDFIDKVVIGARTKRRYKLYQITSSVIEIVTEQPDAEGKYIHYRYNTINGDPLSRGTLVFEDQALTEPFKVAYDAHCDTQEAYWEDYGYWMRKD